MTLTTEQRDLNIERIAQQHAETIVAHANHVNDYAMSDAQFDEAVRKVGADIRGSLYRTDARWLADKQAAQPIGKGERPEEMWH